ncbi:MAG TPA: tRNA uridine-5-carboxymethylaminomethyl(34) synthesis GTPase MnmE [Flavipsychrobacter sp.]|nr:tRNA uridine-5-carboxymethylaminomethyl(34) synthesis GTPase MnmE [Flavipsychrobacter sp.]
MKNSKLALKNVTPFYFFTFDFLLRKMYSINETIVALATPPGEGAIGVIRLSGKNAIAIADKIFQGKNLAEQKTHTLHFGRIIDPRPKHSPPSEGLGEASPSETKAIDEVVISLYRSPKSYTGEDVVEISCHGSNYILEQVIKLCTENGAVLAKPGEFTQRAFINGKLDLTQAEAVADLIASQSSAAHHAAMHNLRGGFSSDLKVIRDELIQFSALIELELDFSEEDVEFADRSRLSELIENAKEKIQKLLDSFSLGNVIKHGIKVAIIGKPNVGKSTLLNALVNEERAIVSDIAGTTRDTIEETLNIDGIIFRLIDTAGIREHTTDIIESIGIERSKKALTEADIVVYLFDLTTINEDEITQATKLINEQGKKVIFAGNKADVAIASFDGSQNLQHFNTLSVMLPKGTLLLSAKNNGAHTLRNELYQTTLLGNLETEGTIVTSARHHAALQEVQKSLEHISAGISSNISGDLIALDIRRCLFFLGEITGEITTEDKLDYIFSKFCIGK